MGLLNTAFNAPCSWRTAVRKKQYQWLSCQIKSALGSRCNCLPLPNIAPEQQAVCETLTATWPTSAKGGQLFYTLLFPFFFYVEFPWFFLVNPGMLWIFCGLELIICIAQSGPSCSLLLERSSAFPPRSLRREVVFWSCPRPCRGGLAPPPQAHSAGSHSTESLRGCVSHLDGGLGLGQVGGWGEPVSSQCDLEYWGC